MAIIKSRSRKTIWDALDAANATISNTQYAAYDGRVTTAEGDVVTLNADILTLQGDVTTLQGDVIALQNLEDIIASKASNNAAVVKAYTAMPNTAKTIKIVDENGVVVGYTPLYTNANLT